MIRSAFTVQGISIAVVVILLIVAGCSDPISDESTLQEREVDTEILPKSQQYNLGHSDEEAVLIFKLVNNSEHALHYIYPSFIVTLQKWTEGKWKDRGSWYGIIGLAPMPARIEPGDTLRAPRLSLHEVAENTELIDTSGEYRIHFEIYQDESFERLIPEEDRTSEPFEVILND